MDEGAAAAVLLPIKAFASAKARLAPALDATERASLAQQMAERVLAAAAPLPVFVACDDEAVASWASALGAQIVDTSGLDLNGSVQRGFGLLVADGVSQVIVAHADLPLAGSFERLLGFGGVTLVPDRRDDGTNVLVVPARAHEFTFGYGLGSFARHQREVDRLRLPSRVVRLADLQWDVDTPEDLTETGHPPHAITT